jgi:cell division protease FtsH
MVTQWGFSDVLGTVAYGENQEEVFLGHSVARSQNISEETARIIDAEVKRLVTEGWDEARKILTEKADDLEKLAQALLEYETLSGQEIKDLLEKGVGPNRDESNFPNSGPSVSVPVTPIPEAAVVAEAPSTVH